MFSLKLILGLSIVLAQNIPSLLKDNEILADVSKISDFYPHEHHYLPE